ncbi:MAG: uroporphyrinogen decarboxylase [Myxococcota bacterium]|nr:uroporphyrinogen decarboxylase [Myxococcota bacterium]
MSNFIKACRGEPVDRTPMWVMRQAGRYLPEYQQVRSQTTFLGLCKNPDWAAEVTLQPLRRYGMDAGIIFSDILVPVEAMGMALRFDEGIGPLLPEPITGSSDVEKLIVPDPSDTMGFVGEAIKRVCAAVPETPLIGFAGAPFTLASYMIEGRGSRVFDKAKKFMFEQPELWKQMSEKLVQTITAHLLMQVESGCQAVQIFDSWAGHLSPVDYLNFAFPYTAEIIDQIKSKTDVPVILFAKGVHACYEELSTSGADVLGVDWTMPLDRARELTKNRVSLQGNLDPITLLGPADRIEQQAQRVLKEAKGCRGHIFNLGHGIHKTTPPEHLKVLVDLVRREGSGSTSPESE